MLKIYNRSSFRSFLMKAILLFSLLNAPMLLADGLPGEFYVTQRWRTMLAEYSPSINPAFLMQENYISVHGAVSPTLQASFILGEAGVTIPIGLYQTFAVSILGVSTNENFEATKWDPIKGEIVPSGETFKDKHSLYILSYAINPWNKLNLGANLNIYHDANFGEDIIGLSIDLGLSYRFLQHSLLGDHTLGLAFQNVISPGFKNGNGVNTQSANIKISWLAKMWEKRIDLGIDMDIKDILAQTEQFATSAASNPTDIGSAAKNIEFEFNAKLGFWALRVINAYVLVGNEYIGFAGGINAPTINGGRDLQILYQYIKVLTGESITSSHTAYFRGDFGKHREEVYARHMARLASIGPGNLYNQARTLYSQGNYWDAFFIFGKITTEYPDFFKNDWVRLYLGLCQENLDMREFSMENFNTTKKDFSKSVVVPYADLGLMRLNYREGNSSGVEAQFALMNRSTVPDSLKFHAYYLMGETKIKDQSYNEAIQMFGLIPEGHPEYIFAQHSLAIAYALKGNLELAVEVLDNVIQTLPKTKEEKEIVNRSFLLLGFIYYEGIKGNKSLSKAVLSLRKVPETSYYYEDALLGLSWVSLKASQWTDCLASAKKLAIITKQPIIKAEAQLLEAYTFMMDKKWSEALAILGPASALVTSIKTPSDAEKNTASLNYDNDRGNYYDIASKANDLALSSQSSYVIGQIDSIHTIQIATEKKMRDYYQFGDEFNRRSFFARGIEKVSGDIEYALAKAEKMSGMRANIKLMENVKKETGKIDQEMLELQKQLKELENSGE